MEGMFRYPEEINFTCYSITSRHKNLKHIQMYLKNETSKKKKSSLFKFATIVKLKTQISRRQCYHRHA